MNTAQMTADILARPEWTQAKLAERLGVSQGTVSRWLKGTDPEGPNRDRLIEIFADIAAPALAPRERTRGQPIHLIPGEDVVIPGRARLLPVFSGAMGGNGKLIVSSDYVDHVPMPASLAGVQGAYGLMIDGESMIPEYWAGDVAWVNPHLKPARGRNHILFHTPPGGEDAEAIIKRVNGWNDREWDLEQWNPARKFKESRTIWPTIHRVVGKYDAP